MASDLAFMHYVTHLHHLPLDCGGASLPRLTREWWWSTHLRITHQAGVLDVGERLWRIQSASVCVRRRRMAKRNGFQYIKITTKGSR
jgi:hypothetical protein